jgi:hypothetical protein
LQNKLGGSDIKQGVYRHYKGNNYRVLFVAKHSETAEDMVVYQCLYGNYGYWVRPKSMFEEDVMVDGKMVKRFEYIGES